MIAKASPSCSSVIVSGGLLWIVFQRTSVYRPLSRRCLATCLHLVAGAVVGRHRLVGLPVADELEDAEQADVAARADAGVLALQLAMVIAHDAAHASGSLDEPVLLVDLDGGQRGGAAHGMAVVGQAAVEHLVLERVGDPAAHANGAERQVARGEALGHA